MAIDIRFDRIPPGRVIGPHRHAVETIVYVAAGEIVFEHGDELDKALTVGSGDVLYEAAERFHRVRNDGSIDALCLLATIDVDPEARPVPPRRSNRDGSPVRRRERAWVTQEGGISRSLIARAVDLPTDTFMVGEVVVSPGVASGWHHHPTAEQVIVVLSGRGEIDVEGASEILEPLTGIRIAAGASHRVTATSRLPLRYVVIGSPGLDPEMDRRSATAPERQLDA